jgi:hypothetical protein
MRKIALLFFLALILAGCALKQAATEKTVSTANYPKTVAIMPFGNQTEDNEISAQVRQSFSNHFSSKPFQNINLKVVEEKAAMLEKTSGKTLFDIPPKDASEAVGADGLIYGRVTDFKKIFAVAYSQMGVEAEVWMVNAKTGEELWRFKDAVRYHEGGASLSPLGMVMTAVSAAMNLREIQRVRVVNELGWKFNEKIPVPPELKFAQKPAIKNVLSNAKEGPFGKGKVIKVAAEGEKGMIGLFDIGGFKKALPAKEVAPGEYLGEYVALPGDNVKEAPLIFYLRRQSGEEAQWLDITGFITVNTTPPPAITALKGRGFADRVEMNWTGAKSAVLKGYQIKRSKKPLSDYEDSGFTEEERYTDKTIKPGELFYYKVFTVDTAGNTAETSDTIRLALREQELKELPARIEKDTTLLAGSYLVKGTVTVAGGVTLTLMPDTKVFFDDKSALKISGSLMAEGEKDSWIEFLPQKDNMKFDGIYLEAGASRIAFARFKGAGTGLTIKNADAVINGSVFENNDIGVKADGVPSPKITDATIWHNLTGVALVNSKAVLTKTEITQNKTGLSIIDGSPEVSLSNIHSNDINAEASGGAITLDKNYLGSVNTDEMRIKGTASALKVYDAPLPAGTLVDAISNPYAKLTPDEKKAKMAELLMTGGKYFKERNLGKSAATFEEALKIEDSPTVYYYLALSYQGMDDNEKALKHLAKGAEKFPMDSVVIKAYGMLLYQLNKETKAKDVLKEAARLNPGDKQIKFLLEQLEAKPAGGQ